MGRARSSHAMHVALGCAALLTLFTGIACAKPWSKWARSPLASDRTYAAMAARPADSLSAHELQWLTVQRDWRAQREQEAHGTSGISESWYPHHPRDADERFAELAARPFTALADSERAWLVAESAAQHGERSSEPPHSGSNLLGVVFVSALVGAITAIVIIGAALNSIHFP